MKNSMKLLLIVGLIWGVSSSCSKDDDSGLSGNCGNGDAWFELVTDESNQLTEASTKYSMDPTQENCEDLKGAYRLYINALKEISKCVPGFSRSAYQQSLTSAEMEIEQVCQ
ncbi:hypothetical protein KUV50_01280 [Membranicola marinus]|uniref:Lipoprotein n=1 Tax=Membranihabitans marinus TaxID=1227546 RepID=A0A953HRU5_9BACT|nr:hypothetical protein [Membranihabitans marinus]MBY5956748.1 hypothetical protein [Membranihabitans marinus]